MGMEELHTYRFTCEDTGACGEDRSITVTAADQYAAAHIVEKQGWLACVPRFDGDTEEHYLCPQHFLVALAHWRRNGYNPGWLQRHPALNRTLR